MTKKVNKRCHWSEGVSKQYSDYHDNQWGVPVHDEKVLFEFLILEGAQAGLSWSTILAKQDGYRKNFADFDPVKVAAFTDRKLEKILQDPSVVRNRLKVFGARKNALVYLKIQQEFGSFDAYLWSYVDGKQVQNYYRNSSDVPVSSEISQKLSKDLSNRGATFVGPTIMYAYMQAVGLVNDHTTNCYRHIEIMQNGSAKKSSNC